VEQFERDMTITWRLPVPVAIASLAGWREALACHSTLKQRHLEDMDDRIGGYRSNNRQAIVCRHTPGKAWICEGSQDTYTSMNAPRILVDPVCGCSVADTEE
jgi:hypothetical protein